MYITKDINFFNHCKLKLWILIQSLHVSLSPSHHHANSFSASPYELFNQVFFKQLLNYFFTPNIIKFSNTIQGCNLYKKIVYTYTFDNFTDFSNCQKLNHHLALKNREQLKSSKLQLHITIF